MILPVTYVVSESLKASADRNVPAWIGAQIFEMLYLSTISLAELPFDADALPEEGAIRRLEAFLQPRIEAAQRGEVSAKTIEQVFEEVDGESK